MACGSFPKSALNMLRQLVSRLITVTSNETILLYAMVLIASCARGISDFAVNQFPFYRRLRLVFEGKLYSEFSR
jgi:hypothetical protein